MGIGRFMTRVSGPVPNDFYALMEMTVGQDRLFRKRLWVAWSRSHDPPGWLGGVNPTPGQEGPGAARPLGQAARRALHVGHPHKASVDEGSVVTEPAPVPRGLSLCPPTPSVPQCHGLKRPTPFEQLQLPPGLGGVHSGTGGLGANRGPGVRSSGAGRWSKADGTVPHSQKIREAPGWVSLLSESQSLVMLSDRSLRRERGDRQLSG